MLSQEILAQLRAPFESLRTRVELRYYPSNHPKLSELVRMIEGLGGLSPLLSITEGASKKTDLPTLDIYRDGRFTGVSFEGVPGGEEFTSFVIAVLNAGGVGEERWPDQAIQDRIRRIRGGDVMTVVSLECGNCPAVIQALNQIAMISGGEITHTMLDGGMDPELVQSMGVQSVPSVMVGGELVRAGKSSMVDLIQGLEKSLGVKEMPRDQSQPRDLGEVDCAVIGGGPAGISAAIYAARKGLQVAMITEDLGGQLLSTEGVENFISAKKTTGAKLSQDLREHLDDYREFVSVLNNRRVTGIEPAPLLMTQVAVGGDSASESASHSNKGDSSFNPGGFHIKTDAGESLYTKTVIIATGAQWRRLGLEEEQQFIGKGVAYCPHCDGPLYRGKKCAVVGGGNSGVEAALDLSSVCSSITLIEYADELKADQVLVSKLQQLPNVSVKKNRMITKLVGDQGRLVGAKVKTHAGDEEDLDVEGVFVQIGLIPNTEVVKGILDLNQAGEIIVDSEGRTSVPGIYACGDATNTPFKQIVIASGEGAKAALTCFTDLQLKT